MSFIADVSSALGEYMLKGWVLTDHSCPNAGCAVPMLRSPTGKVPAIEFCANCDRAPQDASSNHQTAQNTGTSSTSSLSQLSRSSTPPTDISDAADFSPPPETEQSRRRREQSDRASSEIGKRLLKGWAMLAEECPNPNCYGVPLVRPPKAGGEKDPRMECVICGSIYLTEADLAGRERLVLSDTETTQLAPRSTLSNTPNRRTDRSSVSMLSNPTNIVESSVVEQRGSNVKNTQRLPDSLPLQASPLAALDQSSNALQTALLALSTKLNVLSSSLVVDPAAIASTADAISKVSQALTHVRQLQWSETHANGMQ